MKSSQVSTKNLHELVDEVVANYLQAHEKAALPQNVYRLIMSEVEKTLVRQVMRYTLDNQLQAAKVLGISRNTLARKLREHNLISGKG
ncbi:MAG: hypothetical protein H6849_01355 [Alphaproteobacteria bacterium]|nr:MAG: hypothetical protein H6849_01355 [Alphaproteobacteria bacterium]